MEESNKQAVLRYYDGAWNKNNLEVIDEIFEPDYIVENLPPWRKPGAKGLKEFLADNHKMFSNIRNTIEDVMAEGDKVAVRFKAEAIHVGVLDGPVGKVPVTNKKVYWRGMAIFQLRNGKVMQAWGVTDNLGLMQQLGAIPEPQAQ
jgi:predicted ester cyclase